MIAARLHWIQTGKPPVMVMIMIMIDINIVIMIMIMININMIMIMIMINININIMIMIMIMIVIMIMIMFNINIMIMIIANLKTPYTGPSHRCGRTRVHINVRWNYQRPRHECQLLFQPLESSP